MEAQAIQKPNRKAISKKTRFEVFKRDGFACQYCGAHPPEVILHVDHINPVANGGKNNIDNLVTACQPCNLGKSSGLLSDIPMSLKDKAERVQEMEAQIIGYQQVMNSRRIRIEDESEIVHDVFSEYCDGFELTSAAMASVRKFVERLGVDEVRDAMERACTYRKVRRGQEFKYFCGICWGIIKGQANGN